MKFFHHVHVGVTANRCTTTEYNVSFQESRSKQRERKWEKKIERKKNRKIWTAPLVHSLVMEFQSVERFDYRWPWQFVPCTKARVNNFIIAAMGNLITVWSKYIGSNPFIIDQFVSERKIFKWILNKTEISQTITQMVCSGAHKQALAQNCKITSSFKFESWQHWQQQQQLYEITAMKRCDAMLSDTMWTFHSLNA